MVDFRPVKELYRRTAPGIAHLTLDGPDGRRDILNTTLEHPFFVEGKGWLKIRRLEKGDRIVAEAGRPLVVAEISRDETPTPVYNFEVAEDHNYFAGVLGAEAHNASWSKFRQQIMNITNCECFYCGEPATQIDHYYPRSKNPADPNNPFNLSPVCQTCNSWKYNKFPWTNGPRRP